MEYGIFFYKKSILIVLISSFYITGLIAQELDFKYACGTEFLEDIKQEMFRNRDDQKSGFVQGCSQLCTCQSQYRYLRRRQRECTYDRCIEDDVPIK